MIAAMRGYVIGSGVEIACLCDIRIAADDAQFAMPEVALGMIPAAGGTQTLRRVIGASRAMEMVLSNRRIGAEEARRIGLAHTVVPADTLMTEADEVARRMAALNPNTLALAKRAVLEGMDMPLAAGLELERRLTRRANGIDRIGRETISQFAESREIARILAQFPNRHSCEACPCESREQESRNPSLTDWANLHL